MSEQTFVPQEEKKGRGKRTLSILLILILLGVIGFLGYELSSSNSENKDQVAANTELKGDLDNARGELASTKADLESMKGKNVRLDSLINVYLADIDQKSEQLDKYEHDLKVDGKQLKDMKGQIADLDNQIEMWKANVDSFRQVTVAVRQEKAVVEQNLVVEQQKTTDLTAQNTTLSHKVQVGSLLHPTALYAGGVRSRGNNNKEVKTTNAAKAERIKVCFNTGENQVIDPGSDVTFMVRLVGPDGTTLAVQSLGSGYFNTAEDGQQSQYTMLKDITYDDKDQQVCTYWSQNTPFAEGTYTAEIYQSGYKIGSTDFNLKGGFLTASR